jgi:hypothetical protein
VAISRVPSPCSGQGFDSLGIKFLKSEFGCTKLLTFLKLFIRIGTSFEGIGVLTKDGKPNS